MAWVESLKKTTTKELKHLCKKHDANYARVLSSLKRGFHKGKGFTWKFAEGKGGTFQIYNVKVSAPAPVVKASAKKPVKGAKVKSDATKKGKKAAKPEKKTKKAAVKAAKKKSKK